MDTRYPAELEVARKTRTPLQMAVRTEDVRTMNVRLLGMFGNWTQDSATAVKLARGIKGQNGFELWRLLWVEHTLQNESKALSWRRSLLTPRFPPREQEFSLALQEWEADIDRYASEYGERRAIGDEDMRAVLVTESPSALRQHLAMHASSLGTCAEVREVVVSYLQSQASLHPECGLRRLLQEGLQRHGHWQGWGKQGEKRWQSRQRQGKRGPRTKAISLWAYPSFVLEKAFLVADMFSSL